MHALEWKNPAKVWEVTGEEKIQIKCQKHLQKFLNCFNLKESQVKEKH